MQAMQRLSAYACACLSVCRADEEIVHKVQSNMATCEPAFRDAKVGRGQLPAAAPGGACGCYRAIASGARRLLPILHFLTPAAAPALASTGGRLCCASLPAGCDPLQPRQRAVAPHPDHQLPKPLHGRGLGQGAGPRRKRPVAGKKLKGGAWSLGPVVGAWQQLAAVVRQLTPFLPHKCLPFRPPPAAALQERAWVTGLSAAMLRGGDYRLAPE